jgi:hypothetical protein
MTLVLDGMPSAGGPRSRRASRVGALPSLSLASVVAGRLVVSVRGSGSPAAAASAPSSPLTYEQIISRCEYLFGGPRTYGTARAAITASTATSTSTPTARWLTLIALLSILSLRAGRSSTLGLLGVLLGLARKLDGDLAVEDLLTRELSDGTLSLAWGREVDEGIAYGAVGARVLWDRGGFAERRRNVSHW